MARYIDADALTEMLNKKAQTDLEMGLYNHGTLTQSFIRFVERQPTADVAPRAEVAREIFEELEKNMVTFGDVALSSYFKGIGWKHFKELKKKYTEPDPPKGD